MEAKRKKVTSFIIIFSLVLSIVMAPGKAAEAAAPSGIAGNGTGGIFIDINAAPYTNYANIPTWGQYAYTEAGCAWFASSRVNQLTGAKCTIYSGKSWYNSAYASFGFSRGRAIQAKALACYENHVAVVENVSGDSVVISEGGYTSVSASNGYCIIHTLSRAQVESARGGNFLGYVYLGAVAQPSVQGLSYTNLQTTYIDTWNANLYGEINNPGRLTVSEVGVQVWDSAGTLVVNHREGCGLNNSVVKQQLNIVGEALPSGLRSGETYTWKMFAVANGTTYTSGTGQFTIKDAQKPSISSVMVTDISPEGYTVSCTVTDNYQVAKVQFPTWTDANGQDDLLKDWGNDKKAAGTKNGNTYTFRVKVAEHNNESGIYHTHIYAWDKAGNQTLIVAPDTRVPERSTVSLPTLAPTLEPTPAPDIATQAPALNPTQAPGIATQAPGLNLTPAPGIATQAPALNPTQAPGIATQAPALEATQAPGIAIQVPAQSTAPSVQQPAITPEPVNVKSTNFVASNIENLTSTSVSTRITVPWQYMTEWGIYFGTSPASMKKYFGNTPKRNVSSMIYDWKSLSPDTVYYYYFYYSTGKKTVGSKLYSFATKKSGSNGSKHFEGVYNTSLADTSAKFQVNIPSCNVERWGIYFGENAYDEFLDYPMGYNLGNTSQLYFGWTGNLKPNTKYYYSIYYVSGGSTAVSQLYYFVTKSSVTIPPQQVSSAVIPPKQVTLYSLSSKKKKVLNVQWMADMNTNGYQIQYATDKKFKNSWNLYVNSARSGSKKISGLRSKKKYYVRVRAYKNSAGGAVYGGWSVVKNCKVK